MTDSILDIASALQTYVVSPLNAFGLGGFVFDLQGEDTATLSSDITDHYTENNTFIQDHIAIKPKRITLRGYVGELINDAAGQSTSILQEVTQKLTEVTAYLPLVSSAASQAQAAIASISGSTASGSGVLSSLANAVPAAANIYGLVQNLLGVTTGDTQKQQSAYQYFAACQSTGTLMGIQTPWEFLTNMAVETIVAIQSEDSIFVTDFSITFKQMRFATIATTTAIGQGDRALMAQLQTNLGSNSGQGLPNPALPGAQGSLANVSNIANSGLSNIFHYGG